MENMLFSGMTQFLNSAKLLDSVNGNVKSFFSGLVVNKIYGKKRASQKFAKKSFRKQFVKKQS